MLQSPGGVGGLRQLAGRPLRRTLLVFLWLCMVYGVFHLVVRDGGGSGGGSGSEDHRGGAGIYSSLRLNAILNYEADLFPSSPGHSTSSSNSINPLISSANKLIVSSSTEGAKIMGNLDNAINSALAINSASGGGAAVSSSRPTPLVAASSSSLPSLPPVGASISTSTLPTILKSSSNNYVEDEPLVDKETRTIEELILEAAGTIRNIPLPPYILGGAKDGPKFYKNNSCSRFPTIYDLEFSNSYWQTLRTSNGTLHLYGAYYDVRTRNRMGPSVRILGMMDRIEPNVSSYCQLWFEHQKEPVFAKVLEYKYIWFSKWGNYKQGVFQPYLLACQIPKSHHSKVPRSVSVVEKPCHGANNNLRVLYDRPEKKKGFAVCVKGLDFLHEDLSVRLVEWIELLGLLGADKIFFYELAVHPNITKVLRYFQSTGQIDVTPLTLPGGQPNDPRIRHIYLGKKVNHKRQNEVIPYNDCLYRNLYQYEYIALLDIDEVIMPMKGGSTWKELMVAVDAKARLSRNDSRASYNFRNIYFMDDMMHGHEWFQGIPRYMHMLQHVFRSRNYTKPGQYVKCFHNPERVITLHNHFPLACLNGSCTSFPVPTEFAQLQHYRATCVKALKNCDKEYKANSVLDTTIWRYKDALVSKVSSVLKLLGFIPSQVTPLPSTPDLDASLGFKKR